MPELRHPELHDPELRHPETAKLLPLEFCQAFAAG